MQTRSHRFKTHLLAFALILYLPACFGISQSGAGDKEWPIGLRHVGAIYLEAEPGELEVEVFKRDSAAERRSQRMRLFLAAADGSIVDEFVLPAHDFGRTRPEDNRGPEQKHTLRTKVSAPGVYTLLVTFEEYRYGEGATWGFKTNARRYMLDAGSGHKDGLRNERIILNNPGMPGEICFVPQTGDFKIELSDLPDDTTGLTLLDADDKAVELPAVKNGKLSTVIADGKGNRDGIWRLLLPSQQVVAQIEGVTTWADAQTGQRALALWTPSREHYFDLQLPYWLLRPRNLTRIVQTDRPGKVEYTVTNSATAPIRVNLTTQVPGAEKELAAALHLKITPTQLTVAPGKSASATLSYTPAAISPTGTTVRLLASAKPTDGGSAFHTYATLNLRHNNGERSPVTPLELKPWAHEEQLFGYHPQYPTAGEPYFAPDNTPWVIADQVIRTRKKDEAQWLAMNGIIEQMRQRHGGNWRYLDTRISFNREGNIFFMLKGGEQFALVCIDSNGNIIASAILPGKEQSSTFIEPPNLFAPSRNAPLVYRATRSTDRPRVPGQRWGRNHRLEILVPQLKAGELTFADPILVSETCIGLTGHSGPLRPVIGTDERIYAAWGETSAAEENHSGVPIYAASWDRNGKPVDEKTLLGYAPPVNDSHNTPSMEIDSRGVLHVILGSHNQSFQYVHSLQPHSASDWSPAMPIAPGHSQTYIGLVIDRNDTLHLIFREWRRAPAFPGLFDAGLFYQRKERNGEWTTPEALILPPLPHYSVWYHKLTADQLGRLFLSYDYWSTWMAYRSVERQSMVMRKGMGRKLYFSGDGGQKWYLAEDADFATPVQ